MTTGCACGTPGCRGLAPARGQKCQECRIAAHPNPVFRAVLRAISRALTGPPLTVDTGCVKIVADDRQAEPDEGREATS